LLNRASWDEAAAMSQVRKYAAAGLDEAARRSRRMRMAVGALDETGQEKQGTATAGVKRQYMGCAGRVANGINTVHLSYVREKTGHALVGARQWIPAEDISDPVKSLVTGLPLNLRFRTKGQLAADIMGDAYGDGLVFDFVCGDEVYGSCTDLREFLEPRAGIRAARRLQLRPHARRRDQYDLRRCREDAAERQEELGSALGGHGIQRPALVRLGVASHRVPAAHPAGPPPPEDRRAGLSLLLRARRAAGVEGAADPGGRAQVPVEESFALAKGCFGLDQCQARLYTAILRHTVLVMAALAICAVTAAQLQDSTGAQAPPPASPGTQPLADPGLIPLTVRDVKRLLTAALHRPRPPGHAARWLEWRRRHQARSRWFHQRARLHATPPWSANDWTLPY
jgi:hypothetical protein